MTAPLTLPAHVEARFKREETIRRAEAHAKRLRAQEADLRRKAAELDRTAALYEEMACRQSWLNEISETAEQDGDHVARALASHDPKALKQALCLRDEGRTG